MPRRTPRPALRRFTAFALFTTLIAGVTSIAPSSVASPEDRQVPESDAVVFAPTMSERLNPAVDHSPPDARRTDASRGTGANGRADAGNVIDVAFVYPAAILSQPDVNGLANLRTKFTTAINEANRAFANSGVAAQLRYVGDRQVAAPTGTVLKTMIDQLRDPDDGVYDEAQALREETHADLVTLWASGTVGNASCGIGSLGGTNPQFDPEGAAWTVLYYTQCIDTRLVFPHEIGHNLSGQHDDSASQQPSTVGKPYARGYADPARKFVTVMSYFDSCVAAKVYDCRTIPYFSSPTIKTPEGYATGTATTDNARAVAEQAPIAANYRQSQIYSAVPTISGAANRGKTLTATAAGWAPGNVTFTYQWTADGVPIAGATAAKLSVGKSLVGRSIAVTVTGAAPFYTPVAAASAPTAPVGKSLFKKTSRPKIKGAARPGSKVRAVFKSWKPGKKVKYRFTWYRNGNKIKGAKNATYRISRKDKGKKITVKVTGKRKGFESTSRTSRKVKVRR